MRLARGLERADPRVSDAPIHLLWPGDKCWLPKQNRAFGRFSATSRTARKRDRHLAHDQALNKPSPGCLAELSDKT